MRQLLRRGIGASVMVWIAVVTGVIPAAGAEIGFDTGSIGGSSAEIVIAVTAADTEYDVDVVLSETAPVLAFGCLFCVIDSTRLRMGSESFEYETPMRWTDGGLRRAATGEVDAGLQARHPRLACWMAHSTDFSLHESVTGGTIGTFHFTAAIDGPIEFLLDAGNSGIYRAGESEVAGTR